MSNVVHKAFYQVYIDGRQYLNKILSLRVSHGYGQDYAEASVNVTADMPNSVGKWSNIVIIMGGTSGTSFTRFNGFVSDFDITLYPVSIAIICKGNLARAEGVKPEGGTEEDFAGFTDEAVVSQMLTSSNIIPANQNIQGTGRPLGTSVTDPADIRFKQQSNQDNLDVIQQYDQISLGYRTTDSASGVVIRPLVNNIPTADPAIIVTEGVDIFDATAKITLKVPPNSLEVRGFNAIFSYSQFNDWTPPNLQFVTENINNRLIESSYASEGIGISAEEVAQYFSGQWFDYKVECEITTWRSDLLAPGQTAEVHAPTRLRLSHYLFWLHTVVTEIGEDGTFTQTLSLTSELTDNAPFTPVPTPGMQPNTPATQPPSDPSYNIDFTILAIDKEKVIIADVEVDLYVVYCEDLSTATSTTPGSRVWTASAGGVPGSGTDSIYVVAFTDLNSASITLNHTYSDAHPGTVTKNLIDFVNNVGVKTRKLYTAASDVFEAFDGETWRTDAPSVGIVVASGNGPIAGTGVAPEVPVCDTEPPPDTTPDCGSGIAKFYVAMGFPSNRTWAYLTDNTWNGRGFIIMPQDPSAKTDGLLKLLEMGGSNPATPRFGNGGGCSNVDGADLSSFTTEMHSGGAHVHNSTQFFAACNRGDNTGLEADSGMYKFNGTSWSKIIDSLNPGVGPYWGIGSYGIAGDQIWYFQETGVLAGEMRKTGLSGGTGISISNTGNPGGGSFDSVFGSRDDSSFVLCYDTISQQIFRVDASGWTPVYFTGLITSCLFNSKDGVTWLASILTGFGGPGLLLLSTDGGLTWTTAYTWPSTGSPSFVRPWYTTSAAGEWLAAYGDDLIISLDNGATWNSLAYDAGMGTAKIAGIAGVVSSWP